MKKIILVLITVQTLFAQNPRLSLPPTYFNFATTPPLPFSALPNYDQSPAQFCHNSMIDTSNNIKFFIVDEKVYNSAGMYSGIATGSMMNGGVEVPGGQEICIVPDPANCTKYYIFSSALFC